MKLIVGLGNPGKEYSITRHNMGFMVVENLAGENNIRLRSNRRFKALTGEGVIGKEACYLSMPQTYMNLSGNSVRIIVNWLKVELKDALIVLDDIALPFGTIRIRPKGSDAGHNGLGSVIDCLGTSEIARMRIGIAGKKDIKNPSAYVLSRFTRNEQKDLPHTIKRASSACLLWIEKGIVEVMNRYNSKAAGGTNE